MDDDDVVCDVDDDVDDDGDNDAADDDDVDDDFRSLVLNIRRTPTTFAFLGFLGYPPAASCDLRSRAPQQCLPQHTCRIFAVPVFNFNRGHAQGVIDIAVFVNGGSLLLESGYIRAPEFWKLPY